MPIHDFNCSTCGKTYEKIVKMGTKETGCDICGNMMTRANEIESGTTFLLGTDGKVAGYDKPCFGRRGD